MKRFKVYEVPGIKIGATGRWPLRVREQWFDEKDCNILFETDILELASSMERVLQKKHGYPTDDCSFKTTINNIESRDTSNINTPKSIAKGLETKKEKGTMNPNTPETILRCKETKLVNGTTNPNTPASKAKAKETKLVNGTTNPWTTESIAKAQETKSQNNTGMDNPEIVKKMLKTKIKNGTTPSSPDVIAKCKATRDRNGNPSYNQNKVACRDLRTGLNLSVTKEEFNQYDYLVGNRSKKPNYQGQT